MAQSPMLVRANPSATVTLAGWTIAQHFGDATAEHLAVRSAVGVMDRSERGRIEIVGADRAAWLNRLVSNDVEALSPGQGQRAYLVTPKGRIGCDLRIYNLGERLWLETAFDSADGLLLNLRRFKMFGDRVEVREQRQQTVQLGVHGPGAALAVQAACALEVGELPLYGSVGDAELTAMRVDGLGEPGYDLVAPAVRGWKLWQDLVAQARPFGWQAAETLRIEAGVARWPAELSEDVMPLETGLDDALSHTKGCYPGQEYVARMRDRGHANRLLRHLKLSDGALPERDSELKAGEKVVGTLTSVAQAPNTGAWALAYVRVAQAETGVVLAVGDVEATVVGSAR